MSLFDGSGGFPLAGAMHGIMPVYASEVAPYPIAVSKSRFPHMKHLGSVTEINGAELDPVDAVTFGSPCQGLSVAGLQKGIHDDERSNLFFEAVRIIKEMREKDARTGRSAQHVRPRFAVWENVPGAYSSNGGRDFQAALQALAEIADPDVSIPFPEKGKWTKAGCIVGDGWSIAWRTLDAQFCGVPQRRKRIYLVADFGSERAGEILFECEGVSGHFEPSTAKGQGVAANPQGSVDGNDRERIVLDDQGGQIINVRTDGKSPTLRAENHGNLPCVMQVAGFDGYNADITGDLSSTIGVNCGMSTGRNGVILEVAAFMGGQGAQAGSIAYTENCSPTLRAVESGSNQVPDVVYPYCKSARPRSANDATVWKDAVVANTLNTFDQGEARANELVVEAAPVFCLQGNGIDRAETAGCNGAGWKEDISYTLNTIDRQGVSYTIDGRNAVLNTEKSGTLQAKPNGGFSHNFINPVVCRGFDMTAFGQYGNGEKSSTLKQRDYKDATDLCVETGKPPRKWIVRRLMPVECARLQGFPDCWGVPEHKDNMTDEEAAFWEGVRKTDCAVMGKTYKPMKTREQLVNWYNNLHTDSAEYKMWGNGIALPCAAYVLGRIAKFAKEASK